jgi:DNA-damage-inducible protein J
MSKSDMIRARVKPGVKEAAEKIFSKLGLSVTEAITMFYHQVKLHNGLPFEVRIPNEETQMAMREARTGKNLRKFSSIDELKSEFE